MSGGRLLPLAVTLVACGRSEPPPDEGGKLAWHVVEAAPCRFSVELPGAARHEREQQDGMESTDGYYAKGTDGATTFVVGCDVMSAALAATPAPELFQRLVASRHKTLSQMRAPTAAPVITPAGDGRIRYRFPIEAAGSTASIEGLLVLAGREVHDVSGFQIGTAESRADVDRAIGSYRAR